MSQETEERLSMRQAVLVWSAAALTGWVFTVGAIWLAAEIF